MRETKGERTKRLLLEAAIPLFAEKGFHEASFQDIADRAQVSQSAALYHFKNKLGLIADAIEWITAQNHRFVDDLLEPRDGGVDRIKKYIMGNLEWVHTFPTHAQVLILLYSYAFSHPQFREIHLRYEDIAISRTEEHLYAAQREGKLLSDIDVPLLARALFNIKLGVFTYPIRPRTREETLNGYKEILDYLMDRFVVQ